MAGRLDAKTDESERPLAATIVAAWTFQGLFLGAVAWLVWSDPLYWTFADDLSLQAQVVLIALLPALLSGAWLIGLYGARPRIGRLSLFVVIDVLAGTSLALYFGAGLSLWAGSAPLPVEALGGLPLQLFVIYAAAAPTLFGVAWLILRYARPLTDAVERLQRPLAHRRGLRNADHAARKRSPQL
jgi:hypothetical protein